MGRITVRRLWDKLLENEDVKLKIQVCTEFIERESVRTVGGGEIP